MNKKLLDSKVKLADANGNMVDIPVDSIYMLLANDGTEKGVVEYDEDTFPIYEIRHNLFNDIAHILHTSWNDTDCITYVNNLCKQFLDVLKEGTICSDENNYKKIVMAILKEKCNEYDKGSVEYLSLKTATAVVKNEDTW